jgi:hypothetical protein
MRTRLPAAIAILVLTATATAVAGPHRPRHQAVPRAGWYKVACTPRLFPDGGEHCLSEGTGSWVHVKGGRLDFYLKLGGKCEQPGPAGSVFTFYPRRPLPLRRGRFTYRLKRTRKVPYGEGTLHAFFVARAVSRTKIVAKVGLREATDRHYPEQPPFTIRCATGPVRLVARLPHR